MNENKAVCLERRKAGRMGTLKVLKRSRVAGYEMLILF